MATTKVRWVHAYIDDATTDLYGAGRCTQCGLPQANRVHQLRVRSDDERAFEQRRVGER